MTLEFYSTFPYKIDNKVRFNFSILPTLNISENAILFHWMFWGINVEYK